MNYAGNHDSRSSISCDTVAETANLPGARTMPPPLTGDSLPRQQLESLAREPSCHSDTADESFDVSQRHTGHHCWRAVPGRPRAAPFRSLPPLDCYDKNLIRP